MNNATEIKVNFFKPNPSDFKYGWVSVGVQSRNIYTSYNLYYNIGDPTDKDIDTYRQSLLTLKESLADAIGNIQIALDHLPSKLPSNTEDTF